MRLLTERAAPGRGVARAPYADGMHAATPQEPRRAAMRAGLLLGWLSVAAVLIAIVLDVPARQRELVALLAVAAAIANAAMALVPWRRLWGPRGHVLRLDLWAGGLLAFVALLVVSGGGQARFDLLLFLVLPFIAVTHEGRRLALWLTAAAVTYAVAMVVAPDPLAAAEVALHTVLLCAAVVLALSLAQATREHAAAAARAAAAAELEQALLAEAHHRVKNSLQTVADLLLLGRPDDDAGGDAFDRTAERIRSIAAVHHLLAGRRGGAVAADELLRTVVEASAPGGEEVVVVSDELRLPAAQAQQLGIIVNELVANALRHGRPPATVVLAVQDDGRGAAVRLEVRDGGAAAAEEGRERPGGAGRADGGTGLGLTLVRQIAQRGLHGDFALERRPDGATRATLRFNVADADPDR